MKPAIWGKHAWILLHTITLNYPAQPTYQDKVHMVNFFHSLGNVLPCIICNTHFKLLLQQHPLTNDVLSGTDPLVKWLILIHNEINKQLDKKTYTYDEVMDYYTNMGKFKLTKNMIALILLIFVILYILIIWRPNLLNRQ